MYELRCKVSDAKLASALTALTGLTFGLPTVTVDHSEAPASFKPTPVVRPTNAPYHKKKGRKKPLIAGGSHLKGTGAVTVIRSLIDKLEIGAKFTAREASHAVEKTGYSKGAYSHGLKLLMADGSIKPMGFGHYEILKKSAAQPDSLSA